MVALLLILLWLYVLICRLERLFFNWLYGPLLFFDWPGIGTVNNEYSSVFEVRHVSNLDSLVEGNGFIILPGNQNVPYGVVEFFG